MNYIILILTLFILIYLILNPKEFFLVFDLNYLIILIVIILILIIALLIIRKAKPKLFKKIKNLFFEEELEEFDSEKYIKTLRNKILDDNTQKDILELMLDNMKEIKDYYVISKKQAKRSFSLALVMCFAGLLFIIISTVLATIFKVSILIYLIPAIGGSLAELIAATSLIVYKNSIEQLHNYYESLHNNERFLSLVNLVNKISLEKRDDAYYNIINIELQNYRAKGE